uniref:Uncharacterized protein n=1 Tax=Arundo donax TaxID=35708 RepID=A0A0A9ERV6_ARUDO
MVVRRRGGRWRGRGPRAGEVGGPVGARLAVEQRGRPRRAQHQRQPRRALHLRLTQSPLPPARQLAACGGGISASRVDPALDLGPAGGD